MPTSSLVRAAFFALGAAVGGGAVAALNVSKKKEAATTGSTEVTSLKVPRNTPLVEVGVAGDPRFSAGAATAVGPVLKYGNPGTYATALDLHTLSLSYRRGFVVAQAPFPTNSCAERMWRRMIVACGIPLGSVYVLNDLFPLLSPSDEGRRVFFFIIALDGGTFDARFSREISPRGQGGEQRRDRRRSRKFDVRGGRVSARAVPRKVAGLLPQRL